MCRIAVLGAGSWGTALAIQLAHNGHPVRLWGHLRDEIEAMRASGENARYLPGVALPDRIEPTDDLPQALADAEQLLIVVPSHAFAAVARASAPLLGKDVPVAWASKGFEPDSGRLLHEVAAEHFGDRPLMAVSGPTFAGEVARRLPTAIAVAGREPDATRAFAGCLHGGNFRAYTSDDLIGVQVGGASKNVMAIAAGISDGLGFGANARAALITRGLAEITRLGLALGGQAETFMGLTGLGDLVLTCTDDQSRNRRMGLALARGLSIEQARKEIGQEVEGVGTAREVYALGKRLGVEMPITEQVYRVLYEQLPPQRAVQDLLEREARPESDG